MEKIQIIEKTACLEKSQIRSEAAKIIDHVKQGKISALDAFLIARAYEDITKIIKEEILTEAMSEAEKFHKDERVRLGAKFSLSEGRTTFNYEEDAEYSRIKEELATRKGLLDQAIKAQKQGLNVMDPRTGEWLEAPTVKGGSKPSISVTFT